jgi:hypothetical protein
MAKVRLLFDHHAMIRRSAPATLLALALACSSGETIDWSGEWVGTASWIVDGERNEAVLRLQLTREEEKIQGTVFWGGYPRRITSGFVTGREITIDSATDADRLRLKGYFRNDALTGQFAIHYPTDPEPYPGGFEVTRKR